MTKNSTASNMQVNYDPREQSWVLVLGDEHWLVEDRVSALTLCGQRELHIAGRDDQRQRELCIGRVYCLDEDEDGCVLEFVDWDGVRARDALPISSAEASLDYWTWLYGNHPDNWVDISCAFHVEGANRVDLDLYLPETEGGRDKSVSFVMNGQIIHDTKLLRNQLNSLSLTLGPDEDGTHTIRMETEYPEPMLGSSDVRQLGCVVVNVTLARQELAN